MSPQKLTVELMDVIPAVMKVLRQEMRRFAAPEMSVAHFRTLAKLSKGAQTNKDLADWIGISPSSMCRAVDILIAKGLARRWTSADDRREVHIELTPAGLEKVEQVRKATRDALLVSLKETDTRTRHSLAEGLNALREVFHL